MVGTGREVRLKQNLKYTKCPVSIILNVKHWEYYEPFITIPFTETVGVGAKSKTVQINTYSEMKRFLLSDDSLYCFSNSSLDLSNVTNMYDMKIAVFTYSSGGSLVPH